MKRIAFYMVFISVFTCTNATNYYLSSTLGNDLLNTGRTPETPWKSIDKLNTALSTLLPGDSVFFKANDEFYGQLNPTKSGSTSKYIYFGSYGVGSKPCISGTTMVSVWNNSTGNIWEATCTDCGNRITNFFINGQPQQIGRWPNVNESNKGYLSFESHIGKNQITDKQLTGTINWSGAEAVVRTRRWLLDRLTIKSQNADTLFFSNSGTYDFYDGWGYFIQNDLRTLDQQGEWYFNPNTKKISLYSQTNPNLMITRASKLGYLMKMTGVNYVLIENLRFVGSLEQTIDFQNCKNIIFRNNEVDYSGENGVSFLTCENIVFESNMINHTNNNALVANSCNRFQLRKNNIKNTALVGGMGLGNNMQYFAVQYGGKNMLAEFNTIDSVGYAGFDFRADSVIIKNNVISNYCIVKDDGGGLYAWSNGTTKNYSRKLIGNIVMNAIGAPEGCPWSGVAAEGIYMDERSYNVDIIGNTIYRCGNNGIYIHNSSQIMVRNNTVYDNENQLCLLHDQNSPTYPITNCTIDSNIFVSREAVQPVATFTTTDNGINIMGNFDYNYYCRPFDDNYTISTKYVDGTTYRNVLSLEGWKMKYQNDKHSGKSPIKVDGYKILDVKSNNFFLNPNFDNDTKNWSSFATYGNGKIELSSESVTGNALKASFTSASGKSDGIMIVMSNSFIFEVGKSYKLRFSAKGSSNNVCLRIIPRKSISPYTYVAVAQDIPLDTTYKIYEFIINPTVTEVNSRIDLEMLEGQGTVWLNNFEMVEVNVEYKKPDDYIFFEINSTNTPKVLNITADYVDVKGVPVSNTITLQPYSSVILFKNPSSLTNSFPISINDNVQLFPNPARSFVTIKSPFDINSVNMFDISGRLISKYYFQQGSSDFTIGGLSHSGLYVLQIQTSAGIVYKKLHIQNK